MEGSFSVTFDPESGTMYAAYRTAVIHGTYSHYLDVIKFSKDDGLTWTFIKHPGSYMYSPGFNYRRYCLSFAPGVENHVYAAYTTIPPVDYPAPADASHFKQIRFVRVPADDSGNLDRFKKITDNATENTDARVAAAYDDNNPGVWVVYTGFLLIIAGCIITFFMSHRQLYIKISPGPGGARVQVAGAVSKNRLGYEDQVGRIARLLENRENS